MVAFPVLTARGPRWSFKGEGGSSVIVGDNVARWLNQAAVSLTAAKTTLAALPTTAEDAEFEGRASALIVSPNGSADRINTLRCAVNFGGVMVASATPVVTLKKATTSIVVSHVWMARKAAGVGGILTVSASAVGAAAALVVVPFWIAGAYTGEVDFTLANASTAVVSGETIQVVSAYWRVVA